MSASTSPAGGHPPAEGDKPVSVLFVCLGNICRSPMAEAVFASRTKDNARVGTVDSAGTAAYYHEGDPPDSRTMDVLREKGIDDYDHEAGKVTNSDLTDFDYIFAMDKNNLSDLKRMRTRLLQGKPDLEDRVGQIMLFGDLGGRKGEQVADPYYGANNGFTKAYDQMMRFSDGFISQIIGGQQTSL